MARKKPAKKDPNIAVAIIGAVATVIVALIGVVTVWIQSSSSAAIMTKNTEIAITDTPPISQYTLFDDPLDSNKNGWKLNPKPYSDHNSTGRIADGKLFWDLEVNDSAAHGSYSTVAIPKIKEKNFCLLFDARILDVPEDSALVVILRATDYQGGMDQSYYYVSLFSDGSGYINIDQPSSDILRRLTALNKGIRWSDGTVHKVKISFQEENLKIFDGNSNALLHEIRLVGDDLLSEKGEIRLGVQVSGPSQKATVEFDNVSVYNKCQ